MGGFIITDAAQFRLHVTAPLFPQPPNQIGQFQQASGMQLRAPRRQLHERITLYKICPGRWNLAQMPFGIVKVHEALRENAAVLNQIKLLPAQRMERVRDPYLTAFLVRDGCNRWGIETDGRFGGPASVGRRPEHRDH